MNTIMVPVLDTDKAKWVHTGTAAAVLAGFCWILWKLLAVYLQTSYNPQSSLINKKAAEEKKQ